MKIEQLLQLVSDSRKLGGINDLFSMQIERTNSKYFRASMRKLTEEELEQAAGGRLLIGPKR